MTARKVAVMGFVLALFGGCEESSDEDDCTAGTESCPCIEGQQCVNGLSCISNVCVDLQSSATGPAGTDDTADSGESMPSPLWEGGPCDTAGELICEYDATAGETTGRALACNGSEWEVAFECQGLQECSTVEGHDQINCGGTYYAISGGPCANEGGQVCATDQEIVLKCDNGEWIDAIHCPPSNCEYVPDNGDSCWGHWCGNCGYSVGDLCDFPAGNVVCSTDLTAILQCANGTTVVSQACGSGTTCTSVIQDGQDVLVCQ